MTAFAQLRPWARAYVVAVVVLGTATIAHSVHRLYVDPIGPQWFVLAALTLLTGSFTIKVPSINASISVSEKFVFASVLLFGPSAGAITVLLECLTIAFWMKPSGRTIHIVLFNTAAPAIAIWTSGTVFYLVSGIEPYSHAATPLQVLVLPLAALTALYFLLNSWLVTIALSFETRKPPIEIWRTNFIWLSVNYFSGASVAALIVTYTRELDASTLGVIVPLLVVSYLTFRTAMARVEDANNHLRELNKLYLSTVETLAMAIDAKDQITHGHIRRVQAYTVGLAREVGVTDEKLLKAIEAAALLHDMGKLAVPEYILNKPGTLTPAEFEKMKLHAAVGADILSAIDFPYPVAPIVRHHHEHWNGGGYPTGLKGTDIPIGARILSVVDCFDALTSDRPYRPRLSDGEALRILVDRRGSMYDPLIVDTFLKVHENIAPETEQLGPSPRALQEIASSIKSGPPSTPRVGDYGASENENIALYELSRDLASCISVTDIGNVVANHLHRHMSFTICVIFSYRFDTDDLEATYATGEGGTIVRGLRIALGQRLSGWVGANRQTILNSDPVLDLGEIVRVISPRLRACLSTWLPSNDKLAGVISLYSPANDSFTDEHRRIIEAVARQLGQLLGRVQQSEAPAKTDSPVNLPNTKYLEQLFRRQLEPGNDRELTFMLIFIKIMNLKQVSMVHGPEFGDMAVRHVVECAQVSLHSNDRFFRCGVDEIIVLIKDPDIKGVTEAASQISEVVGQASLLSPSGAQVQLQATASVLVVPQDGQTLPELTAVARDRNTFRQPSYDPTRIH